MPFSDLIGNDSVKFCLTQMLQKKQVPQTLLFTGQDGVGKALFGSKLASCLMGEKHAVKIEKKIHPDFHVYFPEGKNAQYSIATIRKIIEESHLPPFEAPCKVFLIHDAQDMPPVASNALLKTFEEPHADTYFILLSSQPHKLLPTILSRTCEVHFLPVSSSIIENWLIAKGKAPEEARLLSLLADGSPAHALEAEEIAERKDEVQGLLLQKDYRKVLPILQDLDKRLEALQNEDPSLFWKALDQMLASVLYWYRDLHALRSGVKDTLFYMDAIDKLEDVKEFPSFEKVMELVQDARSSALRNIRFKTVFEKLLLDLGTIV